VSYLKLLSEQDPAYAVTRVHIAAIETLKMYNQDSETKPVGCVGDGSCDDGIRGQGRILW
jgi:hypothetical protein